MHWCLALVNRLGTGPMAIEERRLKLKGLGMNQRVLKTESNADAIPVVMLHGNPDNADEWRNVMNRLGSDFCCLAPDLPGYGFSKKPPNSYRYRVGDQIRFLDALLDAADVKKPIVLIVHDIGGMAGIPWAAANLDRVRGLVITNTVAFEGAEWFRTVKRWGARSIVGRVDASVLMGMAGFRKGAIFRRIFAQQNPQLSQSDLDRIIETFALNPIAKASTLRQFREATRPEFFDGFDAMNQKIAASVPVQIVWGNDDPYIATKFAQSFATDKVSILDGVGHWPPIVAPDNVANAVRDVSQSG